VTRTSSEERRRTGRPKLRWIDGVLEDIKTLVVKNWWTVARDKEAWRKIGQAAEAHVGLQSY
jgi:hypothetical protein